MGEARAQSAPAHEQHHPPCIIPHQHTDQYQLEQFRKVMKARIMVAVHGAALTNMAFQPPYDSSVVEIIFSPRKARSFLYII